MIVTSTYQRKTFRIQAIQVTAENMGQLAEWCGGKFRNDFGPEAVDVPTNRVSQHRILWIRAFPGDWITRLTEANNFKVYRNKSFLEAFEAIRSETEKFAAILEMLETAFENYGQLREMHDWPADQIQEFPERTARDLVDMLGTVV